MKVIVRRHVPGAKGEIEWWAVASIGRWGNWIAGVVEN